MIPVANIPLSVQPTEINELPAAPRDPVATLDALEAAYAEPGRMRPPANPRLPGLWQRLPFLNPGRRLRDKAKAEGGKPKITDVDQFLLCWRGVDGRWTFTVQIGEVCDSDRKRCVKGYPWAIPAHWTALSPVEITQLHLAMTGVPR